MKTVRGVAVCLIAGLLGGGGTTTAHAQEQHHDVVDAFAEIAPSAAAFHNEKFHEAERALLEGLSRQGNDAPATAQRASLRQASISNTSSKTQKTSRALSKQKPQVAQSTGSVSFPGIAEHQAPAKKQKPAKQTASAKSVGSPSSSAISGLKAEIKEKDSKIDKLQQELADAKSQLATVELEVSRLSSIIQGASRARISFKERRPDVNNTDSALVNNSHKTSASAVKTVSTSVSASSSRVSAPRNDMQVATISVEKADLRLGPGRNHSPLMSLRKGSRLAVEARQGEWYRVFAPNGQRAWIHSSLVRFGDGAASLNDGSSVMVKGYDSKLR